jgi:inorganic pyrophosphatase/exopolyphosphatase
MAYFGELPDEEVQEALNADLKQFAKYGKTFKIVFHVSTLQRGYVGNAIFEEDIYNYLKDNKELYAMKVIEGFVYLSKVSEFSEFGISFGKNADKIKLIRFTEVK